MLVEEGEVVALMEMFHLRVSAGIVIGGASDDHVVLRSTGEKENDCSISPIVIEVLLAPEPKSDAR